MPKVHTSLSKPILYNSYSSNHHHPHFRGCAKLYRILLVIVVCKGATFVIVTNYLFVTSPHHDTFHNLRETSNVGLRKKVSSSRETKKQQQRPSQKDTIRTTSVTQSTQSIQSISTATSKPTYHVVFSTSCIDQQHWESYVLFYHAWKVRQLGTITRIVSGCDDVDSTNLLQFHNQHVRTLSNNFYLHFTPDYSKFQRPNVNSEQTHNANYKYMNKPYGLRHWMESTMNPSTIRTNSTTTSFGNQDGNIIKDDDIIILMDPDMILLRPIGHDYTNETVLFVEQNVSQVNKIVQHGKPIAQQDGYLGNKWMFLNISYVTNGKPLPKTIKPQHGPKYYNAGPPYLATVRDMYEIVKLWTYYAPRVHDIHPHLFAEMYGFIIATTQLNLPFTLIRSLVVSTTAAANREGWPYIDAMTKAEICNVNRHDTKTNSNKNNHEMPIGLHYCKRYLLGRWFFSKYRLKKKFISCDLPLLAEPPTTLAMENLDYWEQPPPHNHHGSVWIPPMKNITQKHAKREAFMLCHLITVINEAARHYKQTACNGTGNMEETINFFDDPSHR